MRFIAWVKGFLGKQDSKQRALTDFKEGNPEKNLTDWEVKG